jgi:hypothetical protein
MVPTSEQTIEEEVKTLEEEVKTLEASNARTPSNVSQKATLRPIDVPFTTRVLTPDDIQTVYGLAELSLYLFIMYACDRTDMFDEAAKCPEDRPCMTYFWLVNIGLLIVALFTFRKIKV